VSENRLLEPCIIANVESGSARSLLYKCCLVKFRLLPVQRIHAQTELAIERIYIIRRLGIVQGELRVANVLVNSFKRALFPATCGCASLLGCTVLKGTGVTGAILAQRIYHLCELDREFDRALATRKILYELITVKVRCKVQLPCIACG
jgi:hypothetical protein